jgi:predicted PurR-regulated permease PerM
VSRADVRVQGPLVLTLLAILVLAFLVFRYFILTFTLAGSVALLLAPAQRALTRRLKGRRGLSAALLVLLCTVALLVPILVYGTLLAGQAVDFFTWVRPYLQPGALETVWTEVLPRKLPALSAWLAPRSGGRPSLEILSNTLSRAASVLNNVLQVFLAELVSAVLDLTIFLMMLFFLLRDGQELREGVRGVSPFTRGQEAEMLDHLANTVRGTLLAMIIVPVVQGVVAFLAYWAFGLPRAGLWGAMTVFAAMIPLIGSPLAWIPASLYLLLTGSTMKAIGLAVYGILVISMVDNIVKPMILRGSAQIHTMLGFLSILGGVYAFGGKGLIVGPAVLSLVLSAYRIYRYDILRWRDGEAVLPASRAL